MDAQKIRIILRSFDHKLIDMSLNKLIDMIKNTGAETIGPIPLPCKKKIYTIQRSTHVNKKSREQFELRTHKRMLDINLTSKDTIKKLSDMKLPAGVDIEVKVP